MAILLFFHHLKAMFGSVEGEGREEKEKGKEKKKEWEKKVFSQMCLDTKRKRNERCEVFYIFTLLNFQLIKI